MCPCKGIYIMQVRVRYGFEDPAAEVLAGHASMSQRYDVLQRLDDSRNCFLGACAGCIEAGATQPLTYVKNCLQQGARVSVDPRVIYRGTGASCLADASLISCQFVLCGCLQKNLVGDRSRSLSFFEEVGCALAAGAASGAPACILELTMIQQQRFGGSALTAVRNVVAKRGATGMLRGLGPTAARESLFAAGYLGLSPQFERLASADSPFATAAASLVSGLICAALTHPIDTIKSCMQGDLDRMVYRDGFHAARTIWESGGGFTPFYRGALLDATGAHLL